jgi:oligoribonuclease (3'-5' exoribonuclease)
MKRAPSQTTIFLDLETTGLDPKGPGQDVLEIGMLAVDVPSFRVVDTFQSLIIEPARAANVRQGADDFVLKMHTANGLWKDLEHEVELARARGGLQTLPRYFDVQQRAAEFYNKHAAGRRVYMGGANPGFDRSWLEHFMPNLARKFHYRPFDTNSLFILREYMFGAEKSGQKHRVLDDCRQAVQAVHDHFELMSTLFARKAAPAPSYSAGGEEANERQLRDLARGNGL